MSGILKGRSVVVVNWRDPDHSMAGGAERYAWEFSRALVAAGAQVWFVTAREPGQARRQTREGIHVRRGGGRFVFYAFAAGFLARHRTHIDAVIDAEAGIPVFSPLWVGDPAKVTLLMHHVHQQQFATYFPRPVAGLGRVLEDRVMPRVYRDSRAVAVSESTRLEMARQLGWSGPVEVLVNGSSAPLERTVHPDDTIDRIAVVGRLSPHKRVDMVVRAVAALVAVRPMLHLDVVGAGPESAALAELVRELDVEKHVTLHGFLDEPTKADVLARTRLHVCASDVEGWGQVVVEAASYGVPTLARKVPGLRGSVRHETTGWLLDEGARRPDLAAVQSRLTVGIERALAELDDPERRAEMAGACRDWAGRFSWPRMHEEAVALVAAGLGITGEGARR